jgi:hypothetical protein
VVLYSKDNFLDINISTSEERPSQGLGTRARSTMLKLRYPRKAICEKAFQAYTDELTKLAHLCFDSPSIPTNDKWVSGVEHLDGFSSKQLYGIMGLFEDCIPGMPSEVPQDPNLIPSYEEMWKRAEMVNLRLRLHQIQGLERMLEQYFARIPIFLFDATGIGKTIQICALIAMIAANRLFHRLHQRYMGQFCACYNLPFGLHILTAVKVTLISLFLRLLF